MSLFTAEEKQLVAATIETPGWKVIERIIKGNIANLKLPDEINPDKRWEDVAVEALGKGYAIRRLKRILSVINKCSKDQLNSGKDTWA